MSPATYPCGADRLPGDPEGYVASHTWAAWKSTTHKQGQCGGCGLWHIWTPRPDAEEQQ